MRFWPVSIIANSPLLDNAHKWELRHVDVAKRLSDRTMLACCQCADTMPVNSSPLTIMYDMDDVARFVYLERPTMQDWLRLERHLFVLSDGDFGLVVDALH